MGENQTTRQTVAVVGLGLIGASLALALKERYRITGCSRSPKTEAYALSHGIVHEIRPLSDLRGVDCVVVCTPLQTVRATIEKVYAVVGESAIITDVGSVKGFLCGMSGRIVGGHPMAGTEHSGIKAAKKHLFENATYCVVPYRNSAPQDVEFVCSLAKSAGARPVRMSADTHDSLAADFSHMPHMSAYALAASAIGEDCSVAGSGFSDCTRIACSDPDFWTEVFRLNRANVLRSLNEFASELSAMRALLEKEDYDSLKTALAHAQKKRLALAAARSGEPECSLTVDVRDEVGSIGGVVDLLAGERIGISNLHIVNSREGESGALMLEFSTRSDTCAAKNVLAAAGYAVSQKV